MLEMSIKDAIVRAVDGQNLSEAEAAAAMHEIVEGEATPAQIGAFATALRMKGETAEEIAGLARIMRDYATRVPIDGDAVDLVGTGGDGAHTFNISTISSFVVAAAGGRVAKHGNRGITSGCGSADILEALGIAIDLPPQAVARCVDEVGFGFMFAPAYHPAMKHAAAPRREIGIRTAFNILGPITNPAWASSLLTGVAVGPLAPKVAKVLQLMGVRHAMVVHGLDGMDELSISAPSQVYEVTADGVRDYVLTPEQFGLERAEPHAVRGGTVDANLGLAQAALAGQPGAPHDVILLNAGAGLYVAGLAQSISDGIALARQLTTSGKVQAKVERIRQVSQQARQQQGVGAA
jgi:anthranilate phosphoribosyltransferase